MNPTTFPIVSKYRKFKVLITWYVCHVIFLSLLGSSFTASANTLTEDNNSLSSTANSVFQVVYTPVVSVNSGPWLTPSTWDCTCIPAANNDVFINHNVTFNTINQSNTLIHDLTINGGGVLNISATPNRTLTVGGDLSINGTIQGPGTLTTLALNGTGTFIQGNGNISTFGGTINFTTNRTIIAGTVLDRTIGFITVGASVTVINEGSIGTAALTGTNTSTWVNSTNSTLSVSASLLATGVLDASAVGNTVNYNGAVQNIKIPLNGQYHNLSLDNGTKTIPGSIKIAGDLVCDAILDQSSGTTEFNGSTTISGIQIPTFSNLTITGSLESSGWIVNVTGHFTNNGVFDAGGGTINFNGSLPSEIRGTAPVTTFLDIWANNTAGLSVETNVDLRGELTVGPNVVFDADGIANTGVFTLVSQLDAPAQDALIGPLPLSATVLGNVTIQRYLKASNSTYRYLSSPVTNATVASWIDDFPITGPFTGASKGTYCGFKLAQANHSMFYYDESVLGYIGYPTTATGGLSSPLDIGVGYAALVRNCTPTMIDVRGVIHQGDHFYNLTFNPTGSPNDGYNLVGNPYPAAIDWSNDAAWFKDDIQSVIAIRDNSSGSFQYLDPLDGLPKVIATGQAFWVQATGPGTFLGVMESAKTSTKGTFYREKPVNQDHLIVSLTNAKGTDQTFTKVRSKAKRSRDNYDGLKMKNDAFDIYTLSEDNLPMAIDAVPSIDCSQPVRLGIRNLKPGTHTLSIETLGHFSSFNYILKDNYKNTEVELHALTHEFTVDANVASAAEQRFTLHLVPKVLSAPVSLSYNPTTCTEDATIVVQNSKQWVNYQFLLANDSVLFKTEGSGESITYTIPAELLKEFKAHTFKVQSVLACGGIAATETATITTIPLPEVFATSDKSCGPGAVDLIVTAGTGDIVNWYETELDTEVLHTGTILTTPALKKSATYYAELTNEYGCVSPRTAVKADVVLFDAPEIMVKDGNVLALNAEAPVTWYFNNEELSDGAEITATESGIYSALTTINGCVARADYTMIIAGIEDGEGNSLVYPNPFRNQLTIPQPGGKDKQVALFDPMGRQISLPEPVFSGNDKVYDVSVLAPGWYLLKIQEAKAVKFIKVVKQ